MSIKSNSIQNRLTFAFLGLAVGPLLFVGIFLIINTYQVQNRGAIELQRQIAAHLYTRLQTLVLNIEKELKMLVRLENMQGLSPIYQKEKLSIFHSQQFAIDDLVLLDINGKVLSYYSRLKLRDDLLSQVQNVSEAFFVPIYQKKSYFGPVYFHEVSNEPLMNISVPIIVLETGEPEGVLIAHVRLKEIWDLVSAIRPGTKGANFIVDTNNKVIAHSNPSVVLRGTTFSPPAFDGIQMGLNGEQSVLVHKELIFGSQHFHIIIEEPISEALSLTINAVQTMLTIIIIALLAAIGFGLLIVRQLVVPLEKIAEAAKTINAGDLSTRVDVQSQDEIGILAGAFNNMTSQLERLINNLEKRVAERTSQLEIANKELESFGYSVSHDLRSPLRHINGYLELLLPRIDTRIDEKSAHYINTIVGAVKKMEQLIDDLLSFSRMKREEMIFDQVDLGLMVHSILEELEPEYRNNNIEWQILRLPVVYGDPSMLRQVISNLISNAIKFTAPIETPCIEIGSTSDDKETIIFVRDNGVGFDSAYKEKLFGVFQRLHSSSEFEGTGVGLAIAQRIILRHGGKIWAESELNKGAVFSFSLPNLTNGRN